MRRWVKFHSHHYRIFGCSTNADTDAIRHNVGGQYKEGNYADHHYFSLLF